MELNPISEHETGKVVRESLRHVQECHYSLQDAIQTVKEAKELGYPCGVNVDRCRQNLKDAKRRFISNRKWQRTIRKTRRVLDNHQANDRPCVNCGEMIPILWHSDSQYDICPPCDDELGGYDE